jgi:Acetyltransferase (GNAT) family.
MNNGKIIENIVRGMIYYSVFLASPPHMEHFYDGMCAWMKPRAGENGAAVVYKACFGDKCDDEIRVLIDSYRGIGIPDEWFLTPLSTPRNVRELLGGMGIAVSGDAYGMALAADKMDASLWDDNESGISVRKVSGKDDFITWANMVNDTLFECIILDPEYYCPMFEAGKITCYLGYYGGEPAAVSSFLNDNGNATLEFIATKAEHRRKGLGAAVCGAAVRQMLIDGADCISLRATPEGMKLYETLGFVRVFDF